jgi:hypothetical protein
MIKLIIAAVVCVFVAGLAGEAAAAEAKTVSVSEATVEKACGDQIEGGCNGKICGTGCTKSEGGQIVDYGCTFPDRPGKTKATCTKTTFRTVGGGDLRPTVGATSPLLKAD